MIRLNAIRAAALILGFASLALANPQTVTFQLAATDHTGVAPSQPMPGGQGQPGHKYTAFVDGKSCTINWNQTSCSVQDIPNGDRLVRIFWGNNQPGKAMQQAVFWINVKWNEPATVVIPSSNIHIVTPEGKSPYPGFDVFVRPSYEAALFDTSSIQTTKNSSNTGYRIATLEHSQRDSGVTFPVLAGCYSIAILDHAASNITRVNYPQPNLLDFTSDAAALCVGGNDTTVTVVVDPDTDQVISIGTE